MTRVPFSFDLHEGFVTLTGVTFLDGDSVVIEMSRALLQMVPLGRDTSRLPADEIESIEVQSSLVKAKLVVRPLAAPASRLSFEVLNGFPGDPTDEIVLPVARKHRAAAAAFARAVRLRNM